MINNKVAAIFSFLFLLILTILINFQLFVDVKAQIPYYSGTTANVSILGNLGGILVDYVPVDFSHGSTGVTPATAYNDKSSWDLGYIRVKTNSTTNVDWCLYINGTELWVNGDPASTEATPIPANNITVNTTCNGTIAATDVRFTDTMQLLCCEADNGGILNSKAFTDVYFWIDIPAGWENHTYNGSFWLLANSSAADPAHNNETWYSGNIVGGQPNNGTNVIIRRYYEIAISNVSVMFGSLAPRLEPYNATPDNPPINYTGWPATFTNGAASNVFIDMYINGTDLNGTSGDAVDPGWGTNAPAQIILNDGGSPPGRGNLTYSNATDEFDRTTVDFHIVTYSLPITTQCLGSSILTANWCRIGNNTDKPNWWNITVEPGVLGGDYGGFVNYKAVDTGYVPTYMH